MRRVGGGGEERGATGGQRSTGLEFLRFTRTLKGAKKRAISGSRFFSFFLSFFPKTLELELFSPAVDIALN